MASRKPTRADTNEQTRSEKPQLAQTEMNALGQTASLIAHDLNNDLTGILGRAQLALGQSKDDKIARHLKIIEQTTLGASQTVLRLQELAHSLRNPTSVSDGENQKDA